MADVARPAYDRLPGVTAIWRQDCYALPTETAVQRRSKGFLSREKFVEAIEVTLGEQRYALRRPRHEASGIATAWRDSRGSPLFATP